MTEERYLQVHHEAQYGFGGNTTIWMIVEEETDDELRGYRSDPSGRKGQELVIRKSNVAGWQAFTPMRSPHVDREKARRAYMAGAIDEEELEDRIGETFG